MTTKLSTANLDSSITTLIVAGSSPKVTAITYPGNDLAADTAGGQTITLTGTSFVSGCSVFIGTTQASVVTVISATSVTFTSPALAAATYTLYLVNPDGGTATIVPGISYSGTPAWTTAAGSLGSAYEYSAISNTVAATGDGSITYSVLSGTLPTGSSLNTSTGVITGTSPVSAGATTYTFVIRATDAQLQDTDRSFSITVNTDAVTWTTPAANSTVTLGQSLASTTTLLATSAAGNAITYTANTLPTGMSISGATVTGTPTVVGNTTSTFTATAATTGRTTTAIINWTVSVSGDTYFPYTTLLLSGAVATETFIADASTNNFALAIAGDTKPNNFNPYTPGYYSNYFDGTGDYLSTTVNLAIATGSFTMEAWVYLTALGSERTILNNLYWQNGNNGGWYLTTDTSNRLWLRASTNTFNSRPTVILSSSTLAANSWTHVAVVRDSNNLVSMYFNGVSAATPVTYAASLNQGTGQLFRIGAWTPDGGSQDFWSGYISNARVVVGTAVYTGTFTPSTTPLTAIANTSLLTCQSNRFVDNSTNAFVVTKYGDTTISPATPFVPNTTYAAYGSTYFDGTGDYLSVPTATPIVLSGTVWTIECWCYLTSSSFSTYRVVINKRSGSSAASYDLFFNITTGYLAFYNGTQYTSSAVPIINAWNHIAAVYDGTNINLYMNGVRVLQTATTNPDNGGNLYISADENGTSNFFIGYINDVRVLKGTVLYSGATYTVPSAPLTAITNTSLLTCQTNQPVNNNVFLDSSTNSFTITRNGNTTQGSFSPYGPNWSLYTNGTSSYAYLPYSATRAIGTGDFSIECWVYIARQPANYTRVWSHQSTWGLAGSIGVELAFGTIDSVIQTLVSGNSTTYTSATYDTSGTGGSGHVRQWIHVVSSRQNGYLRLFVNGILREANTNSTNINGTSNTSFGTNSQLGGDLTEMYISNFRMCIGSVPTLYSTTSTTAGTTIFTPSTTPVTTTGQGATGVQLLVFQDNRIIDRSSNAFAVTAVNNPSIQRFSPFSPGAAYSTSTIGGSVYFDGNGDYLTAPANAAFDFGTGDFTIEVWVYPISNGLNYPTFLGSVTGWSDGASGHRFNNTGYANKFWFGRNGSGGVASGDPFMASTNTFSFNVWHHYSITRSGNTFRMFVNGALENTQTFSGSYNAGLGGLRSGWSTWDGAGGYFTGYTSNLRMLKGTALYTTTFTPPTAPLTAITNTSLLLNMTSAGIVDATMINDLETVGDAKISTTQSKFGSGSMYFDGTGDYCFLPNTHSFLFSKGDFTIELWVYISDTSSRKYILGPGTDTASHYKGFGLEICGQQLSMWASSNGTSWDILESDTAGNRGATLLAVNTWYHVAVSRSGSTFRSFVNGVVEKTFTSSAAIFSDTTIPYNIGRSGYSPGGYFYYNGYMDDLRITRGYARYTSTFTPPTTAFTAR